MILDTTGLTSPGTMMCICHNVIVLILLQLEDIINMIAWPFHSYIQGLKVRTIMDVLILKTLMRVKRCKLFLRLR